MKAFLWMKAIYRIKTTVGQASSKGIAIVTEDGIRAVDQKYFTSLRLG